MRTSILNYLMLISLFASLVPATASLGQQPRNPPTSIDRHEDSIQGAKCLFVGHSFFIPVAKSFDRLARANSISAHQTDVVFATGASGAPGALWKNERRRKQIKEILAAGDVGIFGMTGFGQLNSSFDDYKRWIDLALEYNSETKIFIGQSWSFGGPRMETEQYSRIIDFGGNRAFEVVQRLRAAYPNTEIIFLNYGNTASLMKAKFDAGELDDIDELVGRRSNCLFRDKTIGHAGQMMQDLAAANWLALLYDVESANLKGLEYDSDDAQEIIETVRQSNLDFND